jgi:hypothetical protein
LAIQSPLSVSPAFSTHQGIKDLSKEVADAPEFIKEQAGVGGKTQTEIETIVIRDL